MRIRSFALALQLGVVATTGAQMARTDTTPRKGAPDLGPMRTIEFDTDEGTWLNLDVSPDGGSILFDMLGDIYVLPATGGNAKLLIGGRSWDQMPRWSPDGKHIAFVSDRDGAYVELWVADADGTHMRQLPHEAGGEATYPTWTPDGRFMAVPVNRREPSFSTSLRMFHKD